ncbi:hypothetical protein [Streptomyces cyaneofuscatus]
MAAERVEERNTGRPVFSVCAFEGCRRRFRQRHATGRPRTYCQAACRRRAQRRRDLAGAEAGRSRTGTGVTGPARSGAPEGRRLFGLLLRNLLWLSGLTVDEVADLTQTWPERVAAVIGGDSVPGWPATFMLVTAMRGSPDDARWLWEWARGQRPRRPATHAAAVHRAHAALRGLRFVSALPSAGPGGGQRPSVDGPGLPEILADWDRTRELVESLGGSAERFRPLWEQVRRSAPATPAFLSSDEDGDGAAEE